MSGVVIISRGRAGELASRMRFWEAQRLPVVVMTEPSEAESYRAQLGRGVEVVAHDASDRGVGYARESSLRFAESRGWASYVMADDDTVPVGNADLGRLLRFVERGWAINCGGWLSIHGLWYGGAELGGVPIRKTENGVVPHFGDKLYATNVRLAREAGGYDVRSDLADQDTSEWNRRCVRAGYLWWIHAGVPIREIGRPAAPGGITDQLGTADRAAARAVAARLVAESWAGYATCSAAGRITLRKARMLRDFVGREAAEAAAERRAFRDDDPMLPRREIASVLGDNQLGLGVGS